MVRLQASDIVRHRLVQRIVEAYEDVDRNESNGDHKDQQ
jgi:phosphate starvation-inducible protein PhoH